MASKNDKRKVIAVAAKKLIHQKGFNSTTLADIAKEADVPLGNVYYYFKTKDAIGIAVIQKLVSEWVESFAHWSEMPTPLARLIAFIDKEMAQCEVTTQLGCAMGGLCQELCKQGGILSDLSAKLLHDILQWSEEQFREMRFGEESAGLALNLISTLQGIFLLAHTFKDTSFAECQMKELKLWLENLSPPHQTSTGSNGRVTPKKAALVKEGIKPLQKEPSVKELDR